MPGTVRPKVITPSRPKRAAHRPTKFTPELGEKICELIACGWLMKDAARHFGIPPETVCRWVVKQEAFRQAYTVARAQRTEIWAEECIEIADDASRDYTTDKHGHRIFNSENVHRARLRIDVRKWQMARLDPRLWGDRQEIHVKDDWSNLSEAERVRKAMQMLDIAEELVNRPTVIEATPIRYDPTDGDELAEAERRRKRLEDLGETQGGIGG